MKQLFLISATLLIASSAFAQQTQQRCVTAPVKIDNEVTITSSGAKSVTNTKTYIYYERKHARKNEKAYPVAAISEKYPSDPVLLNWGKDVKAVPEAYNVTVTTPQGNTAVCPDSTLNVSTDMNVEKVSSYTGYYPESSNIMYKKVSKRDYKVAKRKKCAIERKEARIARRAGVAVQVKSNRAA